MFIIGWYAYVMRRQQDDIGMCVYICVHKVESQEGERERKRRPAKEQKESATVGLVCMYTYTHTHVCTHINRSSLPSCVRTYQARDRPVGELGDVEGQGGGLAAEAGEEVGGGGKGGGGEGRAPGARLGGGHLFLFCFGGGGGWGHG